MRIRWRGLELPSRVVCNREKLTDTYGEFHVEPFERGFGHTVGNSLRRILLSSLEGSAVTKIKIQGVQHEFSSIPGMVEDITDLVLNLKGLVVKNHSEQTRTIRIERDRRGRGHRRRHPPRRVGRDHQPRPHPLHPDRRRAVRPRDDRRERPGLPPGRRGAHRRPRSRRDPDRRHLQPGHPRRVPGREHPRRPADQLRQARPPDLDDRHARPRDGPGRGRQDPPQAPQPVRPVLRARPRPARPTPPAATASAPSRSTPSSSASST